MQWRHLGLCHIAITLMHPTMQTHSNRSQSNSGNLKTFQLILKASKKQFSKANLEIQLTKWHSYHLNTN